MHKLTDFTSSYQNNAESNDSIHRTFTKLVQSTPLLNSHRNYIENNKLGFGDRAFHFMWHLLLNELAAKGRQIDALEIGVYKGQVISLWSLLSITYNIPLNISAITPLEGTEPQSTLIKNKVVDKIRRTFSARFREQEKVGNLYANVDYRKIITNLFAYFNLDFSAVDLYKGFSNDQSILQAMQSKSFDLIYIDGDHSFEGAKNDIRFYSALIRPSGYLVMDDASWFLEGTGFWKGHEEVSRAAEIIEGLGFSNVLNVGHNRVYQKL